VIGLSLREEVQSDRCAILLASGLAQRDRLQMGKSRYYKFIVPSGAIGEVEFVLDPVEVSTYDLERLLFRFSASACV
jgi:hypothetical protein